MAEQEVAFSVKQRMKEKEIEEGFIEGHLDRGETAAERIMGSKSCNGSRAMRVGGGEA